MSDERTGAVERIAWPAVLAASAVFGSLALACILPFAALATIASASMGRGRALTTLAAVWGVNQVIGFGLLDYPRTADTIGLGVGLLVAALGAVFAARAVIGERRGLVAPRVLGGFAAAFVAYELIGYGFAHAFGGVETFAPEIVLQVLANDAAWLAGLTIVYLVLSRAAPRLFASPAAVGSLT